MNGVETALPLHPDGRFTDDFGRFDGKVAERDEFGRGNFCGLVVIEEASSSRSLT